MEIKKNEGMILKMNIQCLFNFSVAFPTNFEMKLKFF